MSKKYIGTNSIYDLVKLSKRYAKTRIDEHERLLNPHGITKSMIGLSNVENFKAVSTIASQGLTDAEKSNARTNIGTDDTYAKLIIYSNNSINMGRQLDSIVGEYSTAEGYDNIASGICSHAEGNLTKASGKYSHAEGNGYMEDEDSIDKEYTTASGFASHAEGFVTTASGTYSHSEGSYTIAKGYGTHAEGSETMASGYYTHAEGQNTKSEGDYSHAEGQSTIAKGFRSHAEGYNTIALNYQHSEGHYNDTLIATADTGIGSGAGTAFVIGNGTSDTASNAIRIDYNGKLWCKSAYASTGADYAEYFEWLDGNPDNEDRRGKFVTLYEDKIDFAQDGDYILGIVSANPCVLGNTDTEWQGQFVKDEFGSYIKEKSTQIIKIPKINVDNDGNVSVTEVEETEEIEFYKINPDYDPDKQYTQRDDRPEWNAIGMLGVLSVYDDGTCEVNGYCKCNDNSIATKADSGYRVIKRVSKNIIKIVLK